MVGNLLLEPSHEVNFTPLLWIPLLNPFPLPRSIVIMDNSKIHLYEGLEDAIARTGAILLFLPLYSPELNPIEVYFGLLKKWIQKYANLVFPLIPELVLEIAMIQCTSKKENSGLGLFSHCRHWRFVK